MLRNRTSEWHDRVALAVLGTAAAVLSVWNLNTAPAYRDDEGTYTAQVFSVYEGTLAPYTYGYEDPPLGWMQLGALAWLPNVLGLGDGTYIGATRYAIAPFFVATALLVYLVARRLGVRVPFAALAVAFFVLSPLSLVFGRQVYLDNVGMPWLLLGFWMALSPRTALWHHIGAGVFFAVAVLSNETLVLFGPALVVALLNRPAWANRVFSVVGFVVVGGIAIIFYPLMALLRGELLTGPGHVSLQDALVYQFVTRSGSGSLWEAGSDRAELVNGWLYYDQFFIAAGLTAGLLCLLQRGTVWIPVAVASFVAPVAIGAGYLPPMFIIGVLPFLALAIGVGFDTLWSWWKAYTPTLGTKERAWTNGYAVACAVLGVVVVSSLQWFGPGRAQLTQEANAEWATALAWVQDNVPEDDTILVPYVMWQDLSSHGREDPWTVVPTEKADLDPEFLSEHPEGAAAIDWVVVGPNTDETIESLGLTIAGQALDNSETVQTIGSWSVHRVQRE
ncbi:hypothetical protein KTU01_07480 [Kocuria turfanensis]|uniref:Glycosyltransferase RgtA/B/C/D-like domain-containing protein n=1 Tax=Kocuria turfanensis TaxID=388357 RepID=A0A512IA93_9MICC|nr:hypothetical protein KTU01_07480 [Kocuria turfanensis]